MSKKIVTTEAYLTTEETAALVGLSKDTLKAYRSRNKGLPYIKRGGNIYYRQSDVVDYIRGKLVVPGKK